MPGIELLSGIAVEILSTILLDYKFLPIYVLVILLLKSKYSKHMDFQNDILGVPRITMRQIIEETVLYGLVCGFVVSIGIVYFGITIDTTTFSYLFIILLVLSLINIRLISFSYAAGILALIAIIFGIGSIDTSSLLLLTGILHLVESLLIFYTAGKNNIPVIIKHNDGITGAYIIQRFWVVPIVFVTFITQSALKMDSTIHQYDWLSNIRPDLILAGAAALGLDSIIGIAAYSDISISSQPEKRSRKTSLYTFVYSCILIALALISFKVSVVRILAAIFAIVAREAIFIISRNQEKKGKPLFEPVKRGLKVFDVLKGSHAEKIGIKRGQVILNINNFDIQTESGVIEALKDRPKFLWITVIDLDEEIKTIQYNFFQGGVDKLGILTVPRETEITYLVDHFENLIILKNLITRFRG